MEILMQDGEYLVKGLVQLEGDTTSSTVPLSLAVAYLVEHNYSAVVELMACIGFLSTNGIPEIGDYNEAYSRLISLAPYKIP